MTLTLPTFFYICYSLIIIVLLTSIIIAAIDNQYTCSGKSTCSQDTCTLNLSVWEYETAIGPCVALIIAILCMIIAFLNGDHSQIGYPHEGTLSIVIIALLGAIGLDFGSIYSPTQKYENGTTKDSSMCNGLRYASAVIKGTIIIGMILLMYFIKLRNWYPTIQSSSSFGRRR